MEMAAITNICITHFIHIYALAKIFQNDVLSGIEVKLHFLLFNQIIRLTI